MNTYSPTAGDVNIMTDDELEYWFEILDFRKGEHDVHPLIRRRDELILSKYRIARRLYARSALRDLITWGADSFKNACQTFDIHKYDTVSSSEGYDVAELTFMAFHDLCEYINVFIGKGDDSFITIILLR